MKLLIIRHAIAMERAEYHADVRRRARASGVGDPDHSNDDLRPLTDKGIRKMRKNAAGLSRLTGRPDLLVSSPLKRARQTAEILAAEWGIGPKTLGGLSRGASSGTMRSMGRAMSGDADRKFAKLTGGKTARAEWVGEQLLMLKAAGKKSSKKAAKKLKSVKSAKTSGKKAVVRAPLPGEIAYAVELRPEAEPQAIANWLTERATHLQRAAIKQGAGDHDLMIAIVGHEPHLTHLIGWLLAGEPRTIVDLKKGGACRIDFPEGEIGPGKGQLVWLTTPAMLRALI